ncbi:MAG: cyclodeaminase/cyclohydrolase family protein, partial [Desulfobacula sp.]
DIEVGAKAMETGIWGACKNVAINMAGITDEDYRDKTLKLAEDMRKRAEKNCKRVLRILEARKE